jgi:hypothetical protein
VKKPPAPNALSTRKPNPGWFTKGHRRNITTGTDTDRLPVGLEHLGVEMEHFIAGSLVDEGDDHDIPTRRRSQLEYRARLHRRILQLDAVLDQRGLVDKRGKLRVAWLGQLQSLIAAAVRIDNLLTLDRRPKNANALDAETPGEYLRQLEQEGQTS